MREVYEMKSENLEALPVEELFGEEERISPLELVFELCVEHGRMEALHDYIKAVNERNYLDVKAVKAIVGYEEEEADE